MIDYKCVHCNADMNSPDCMIGRFETCPACKRRMKVRDPKRVYEDSRCSERQLNYASSVGIRANPRMSGEELSVLLSSFDNVKHYFYGLLIECTGRNAAELGIPRRDVEDLVVRLINAKDSLVVEIDGIVDRDSSSNQFLNRRTPLYRQVQLLLLQEFPQYLERG